VSKCCVCVDWIATVMYKFDTMLNLLSDYNTVILDLINLSENLKNIYFASIIRKIFFFLKKFPRSLFLN